MDLNDLRMFVQVVDAGGFSAAERQLGVPKSTLSRRVAALEQQLGVRLLTRSTRALTLTEQGNSVYQSGLQIVDMAQLTERSLLEQLAEPSGTLRVSAPIEEGNELLAEPVAKFLERFPKVTLQLELSNQIVDLHSGQVDLAVRAGTLADSSLVAVKLFDEQMLLVASPDYIERFGEPESLEGLIEHRCLLYGTQSNRVVYPFESQSQQRSLALKGPLTVNSLVFLQQMARRAQGIAVIPQHICQPDLDTGELVQVLPQWRCAQGGIYAVYPHRKLLTPALRSFIDLLREHFASDS